MNKDDKDDDLEEHGYAEEEQASGVVVGIIILAFATYGLMHNNVPFFSRRGSIRVSFHGWSALVVYIAYATFFIAAFLSFYNFMNRKYRSWAYPKEKYRRLKTIIKVLFILATILIAMCLVLKWLNWVD